MKRITIFLLLTLPVLAACDMLGDGSAGKGGELRLSFDDTLSEDTRTVMDIPDTNDFLLYVTDSKGETIYEGTYGMAPESIMVKAGSYTVKAISGKFSKPAFSAPQFGDEQCVVVESGSAASVKLFCSQINSGIRLRVSSDFLTAYPGASLVLKSSAGSLMYGYSEKRIAYFATGNVSLVLSQGGTDKSLMTRWLEPGEILTLGVEVASGGTAGSVMGSKEISVAVDTSRVWTDAEFIIGEDGQKGTAPEDAVGITQAMSSVGEEDIWVRGYIVGGDLTSSSGSFEEPFTSRTNILLGPKPSTTNRSSCLAVQLQTGDVRDNLNLVDNPGLLGRKLYIKGDIVASYYGLVGIKNVTDYELE